MAGSTANGLSKLFARSGIEQCRFGKGILHRIHANKGIYSINPDIQSSLCRLGNKIIYYNVNSKKENKN